LLEVLGRFLVGAKNVAASLRACHLGPIDVLDDPATERMGLGICSHPSSHIVNHSAMARFSKFRFEKPLLMNLSYSSH
jgi:hypothetical protein